MRLFIFVIFLPFIISIRPLLFNTKKLCRDCKYFIPNTYQCGKFGETNIITGKETYENARDMRSSEDKCSEYAIHFEKNYFKVITVPYYFILLHWQFIIIIFPFIWYLYALYNIGKHY